MLSIRRILALIMIIVFVVPFTLWEGSSAIVNVLERTTAPVPIVVPHIKHPAFNLEEDYQFLIVGTDNKVTTNVVTLFKQQNLAYTRVDYAETTDLTDKEMIIICEKDISSVINLENLEDYISSGKSVLFAGGIPEYYTDSYLNPILGIENKTLQFETDKLSIADDFFVVDEEIMDYDGFNSSVWLSLKSAAEVYISDKETSLPVVFSHTYHEGKALIVNGTFLDDPNNMGIVSALMCKGLDTFAYPIMAKSLLYLDSISDIAYDDKCTMAEHGVNSSFLILDKLMPELIALALRHNIAYTASLQVVEGNSQTILPSDLSTTWNVAKEIIKYGGEITYSGNFENDNYQINTQMIESFKATFPNYEPNGFTVNSGEYTKEADNYVISNFPKSFILRYTEKLGGSKIENNIPSFSYGLNLEDGEKWRIINHLTSIGLFSHRMDMRQLAGFANDGESYRDTLENLKELSLLYDKMTWLDTVTMTGVIPSVKSYESLEFTQQPIEGGYLIEIDNFMSTQKFMVYSKNKIDNIIGGRIQAINGNYYIIECDENHIVINWEDR